MGTAMSVIHRAVRRVLQMTGVLPAVGFDRREPAMPPAPEERLVEQTPPRSPHVERHTEIPPDQQPGGGPPHR